MVRVAAKGLGDDLLEFRFHLVDGLARRKAGAIAHSEDVRVDRESLFAEGGIQDHVGSLSANARQGLKLLACARDLSAMVIDLVKLLA